MSLKKYRIGIALLCSTSISMPTLATSQLEDGVPPLEVSRARVTQKSPKEEAHEFLSQLSLFPPKTIKQYSEYIRALISSSTLGSFDQILKLFALLDKTEVDIPFISRMVEHRQGNLDRLVTFFECVNKDPTAYHRAFKRCFKNGYPFKLSRLEDLTSCIQQIADYSESDLEVLSCKIGDRGSPVSVGQFSQNLFEYRVSFGKKRLEPALVRQQFYERGYYKVYMLLITLSGYREDLLPQSMDWILESGAWRAVSITAAVDVASLVNNYIFLHSEKDISHDELLRDTMDLMKSMENDVSVSHLNHLLRLKGRYSKSEFAFLKYTIRRGKSEHVFDRILGPLSNGMPAERRDGIYDWIVRRDLLALSHNSCELPTLCEKLMEMYAHVQKDYLRCVDEGNLLEHYASLQHVMAQLGLFRVYQEHPFRRALLWVMTMPALTLELYNLDLSGTRLEKLLKKINGYSNLRMQSLQPFFLQCPSKDVGQISAHEFLNALEAYTTDDLIMAIAFANFKGKNLRRQIISMLVNRDWYYGFKGKYRLDATDLLEEDGGAVALKWVHTNDLAEKFTGDLRAAISGIQELNRIMVEQLKIWAQQYTLGESWGLHARLLQSPGFLEKCKTYDDLKGILHTLWSSGTSDVSGRVLVCKSLIELNVFQSHLTIQEIKDVMRSLFAFRNEQIAPVCNYIGLSGIIARCDENGLFLKYLNYLQTFPVDRLMPIDGWMCRTRAWDKCVNVYEVSHIQEVLKEVDDERLKELEDWFASTGFMRRCENGSDLKELVKYISPLDLDVLSSAAQDLEKNGFLVKCRNGIDLKELISIPLDYSREDVQEVIEFIKSEPIWDKITNGTQIACFLRLVLRPGPAFMELSHRLAALRRSGFVCREALTYWLKDLERALFISAHVILSKAQTLLRMTYDDIVQRSILLFCHAFYNYSPAVHAMIIEDLENPEKRDAIMEEIMNLMGNDHPLAQEYLLQAIAYDNHKNPNGMLAINREMFKKREAEVKHEPIRNKGLELNLERIRAPKVMRPIHMPLNVWNRLFEELGAYVKACPDEVKLSLEDPKYNHNLTWEGLKGLRDHHQLVALLDPLYSLKTSKTVTGYSMMLREVLKNVQDTGNILTFLQLLMNITTCKTGKLNGIRHSHVYMSRNLVLDEAELGAVDFVKHLTEFVNEELRRHREATLTRLVQDLTKRADPHDLNYVRVLIGAEIGLMYEDEEPETDLNTGSISPAIRMLSKQGFLSRFYRVYQPLDVIKRFQGMLNDGSIAALDLQGVLNFTFFVIDRFLGDALDFDEETARPVYNPEIVNVDENGLPTSFTEKAAELLLLQLGFLKKVE